MKEKQCQTCNFTSDYENHFRGAFCVDCSLGEVVRLTEENKGLKEKLSSQRHLASRHKALKDSMFKMRIELKTLKDKHAWRDVKNELPKDNQECWVLLATGKQYCGMYQVDGDDKYFTVCSVDYYEVTHWMPIIERSCL